MVAASPCIRLPLSSSCWRCAGLPVSTTLASSALASKCTLAKSPVAFSEPCVITTLPLSVVVLLGLRKPSKCEACTSIGWSRSVRLAWAGASTSRPSRTSAQLARVLAGRERGMDVIEQLQVFVVEIGTHADAVDSSAALHQLRRGGGLEAVLLGPGRDVGGVDRRPGRIVEGGPFHVHRPLQLEQGTVAVAPAVQRMPEPVGA